MLNVVEMEQPAVLGRARARGLAFASLSTYQRDNLRLVDLKLAKKTAQPHAAGIGKQRLRWSLFFNHTVVEKQHAIRHLTRKTHFMGHHQHRHP